MGQTKPEAKKKFFLFRQEHTVIIEPGNNCEDVSESSTRKEKRSSQTRKEKLCRQSTSVSMDITNGSNLSCVSSISTKSSDASITQIRGDGTESRRESTVGIELTLNIPRHYIDATSSIEFIIAKINHHKIYLNDYKSLLPQVHLSLGAMNYIFEYLLPPLYVNLTLYANDIFAGVDNLSFTLVDKLCYMPIFLHDSWHLSFMNKKTDIYVLQSCWNLNFCFFYNFVKTYNLSAKHKTKF